MSEARSVGAGKLWVAELGNPDAGLFFALLRFSRLSVRLRLME